MTVIDIIMNQMKYLDMKEKYMRYHRKIGAKNALIAFSRSLEFLPPDEYVYTKDDITEQEEQDFRENEDYRMHYEGRVVGGIQQEEQILGAVDALRAAGVDDEEIVTYIAGLWEISEDYARNHLEGDDHFANRIGTVG